jgi:hypothetical protein
MWGRLDGVGLSDADLTETALSRVSSASSSLRCDMQLSRDLWRHGVQFAYLDSSDR